MTSVIFVLFLRLGLAAETLPTLLVQGTPADALSLDPIVPVQSGKSNQPGASGGIERALTRDLALPITEYGYPGTAAGVRGLGRSVEDTGVQTLGVPLNYAQGGGFDLSIFPQFLWSGYQYQLGPTLGAYDPRAVGGSLDLKPWTTEALAKPGVNFKATQFRSDLGQNQTSGGFSTGDVAGVVGYSYGVVEGPSGMISGRFGDGRLRGQYHLLATNLEAPVRGSTTRPTPLATQRTARAIPILQLDYAQGAALLKTSFFYDGTYLRYEDPSNPSDRGRGHISQVGTEDVLLYHEWRIGMSARSVNYSQLGGDIPNEGIFSGSITRSTSLGSVLLEPMIQGTGVSQFGFSLGGSLGARYEFGGTDPTTSVSGLFSRITSSNRYPSLIDRYFIDPSFVGNSGVTPERDTTWTLGYDYKSAAFDASMEGYYQWRSNVLLPTFNGVRSVANSGDAWVEALVHRAGVKPTAWWDLGHSLTLSDSYVSSNGYPFPYSPSVIYKLTSEFHEAELNPVWHAALDVRSAGNSQAGSPTLPVEGYGVVDLRGDVLCIKGLLIAGSIENVFDRPVEIIRGYPLPGRVYSASLTGLF